MMRDPTEEQIRLLHIEFSGLVTYRSKLVFYNRHFGLLENFFPSFQSDLDLLFIPDKVNEIVELFERERRNSFAPEKKFDFSGTVYTFNIIPLNSNAEILNDYIINHFIESDNEFNVISSRIKYDSSTSAESIFIMYSRAAGNIQRIEDQILSASETSMRNQFMTVFYNGFNDYQNNTLKKFPKRKKVIELYLYSQGILHARYINLLKESFERITNTTQENSGLLDLRGRLMLFRQLGIMDLITKRYTRLGKMESEKKVAELMCLMLGVSPMLYEKALDYLEQDR